MERIALVGGGLIGQAWAIVFGRAGHEVMLYDAEPAALKRARDAIAARALPISQARLVDDLHAVLARIGYATGLAEALDGAAHIQESAPELVEVKRELYSGSTGWPRRMRFSRARPRAFRRPPSPSTSPGAIAAWWRIRSTRRS